MDVILEIIDTFVADHVYAWLFPQGSDQSDGPSYLLSSHSNLSRIDWQYEPASTLIRFEPSPAAYMSALNRDNVCRQFMTLFLLTWVTPPSLHRCQLLTNDFLKDLRTH